MSIKSMLAIAAGMAGLAVHTSALALSFSSQATCSSDLAINVVGDDTMSFICQGDLGLTGGAIEAAGSLSFSSTGSITFTDVLLSSPVISVNAAGSVALLGNTVIDVNPTVPGSTTQAPLSPPVFLQPGATAGSFVISGGGSLSLTPSPSDSLQPGENVYLGIGGQVVVGPSGAAPSPLVTLLTSHLAGSGSAVHVVTTAVPEPASWALMAAGLVGLAGVTTARRGQRARRPHTAC
ncbi:MAG: PEP-CTERM sorting domain-containing protein [Rubrivivax sp.]|nr:MAG: PEP-CTERM sorting domain-containing protein [Rubrivivax sp.]